MKRYIQIIVALVIVMAVIWMARGGIAWASGLPATQPPVEFSRPVSAQNDPDLAPPPFVTDISESGIYNIGGVCLLNVEYKGTNLKNKADAEVPVGESGNVPFSYDGKLLFPGCHVVHFKDGEIVREAAAEDGNWKVCFGDNPDLRDLKIYYYLDNPENGEKAWISLETYKEDTLACANAHFTGVYMPAGRTPKSPDGVFEPKTEIRGGGRRGTVFVPPFVVIIGGSGTYSAGGICSAIVKYYVSGLTDNLHVQFPTEDTKNIPFPDNEDLLYLPGCHFLHYRDAQIKKTMTRAEGEWEICFAAIPGKEMTIYYYRDDDTDINPPWTALETTTKDGLACAPLADFSAVYAPAGK
ncbi:MAG TPA: hypothetical protein VFQ13_07150 [Anaerolineales bacterium]|nr:hypothetical protein [Anaerolineales bacterium]